VTGTRAWCEQRRGPAGGESQWRGRNQAHRAEHTDAREKRAVRDASHGGLKNSRGGRRPRSHAAGAEGAFDSATHQRRRMIAPN
jgi:hypothetical protein